MQLQDKPAQLFLDELAYLHHQVAELQAERLTLTAALEQALNGSKSNLDINERKRAAEALVDSEGRLVDEMQNILTISQTLITQTNINNLLEFIIAQAQHLMNADGATLWLLTEDGQHLEAVTLNNTPLPIKPSSRLPVPGTLTGLAIASQQIQISNSAQDDTRTTFFRQLLYPAKLGSLLCAPLLMEGASLGVLVVWKEGAKTFTGQNKRLMSLFADQVALALYNAHLHVKNQRLAVEQERQRLARELHDSVTQSLHSIGLAAEAALKLLDQNADSRVHKAIVHIEKYSKISLAEMREHLYHLHPTELNADLIEALSEHCYMLSQQYHLEIEFKASLAVNLSASQQDGIYYIAKEALWNIVRHANADSVGFVLTKVNDWIVLYIEDNGVGFNLADFAGGKTIGLRNIEERVKGLSGVLELQSRPSKGTQLIAWIPLHNQENL